MLILAPIAAMLIQLAVSRSREYQADETGAHFTGNPYALASALAKLDAYSRRVPMAATPSTAHLLHHPALAAAMNFGSLIFYPPADRQAHRAPDRTPGGNLPSKSTLSGLNPGRVPRRTAASRSPP